MEYIEIQGYKSIKSARIKLHSINILIGSNGSGKSNFISFFVFLHEVYLQNMQRYIALKGGLDKILFKGRKVTDKLFFRLDFEGGTNRYEVSCALGDNLLLVEKEHLYYKNDDYCINKYLPETQLKASETLRAKYILRYLDGLRRYHFHDTGVHSPFTNLSNIYKDGHYLYHDGSNIAAFLYHIKEKYPSVYRFIVKQIKYVAPYFLDFHLQPDANGDIRLFWLNCFSTDLIYDCNDLSDGTLRFIALTVLFMQPELPSTIIIDEPELGLHPAALSRLSGMVKSASQRHCQVIMATQSVELINFFHPEDIVIVDQVNGETIFRREDSEHLAEWIEKDYTMGELWSRNMLVGGFPNK